MIIYDAILCAAYASSIYKKIMSMQTEFSTPVFISIVFEGFATWFQTAVRTIRSFRYHVRRYLVGYDNDSTYVFINRPSVASRIYFLVCGDTALQI